MSLARQCIFGRPQELERYLASAGFRTDLPGVRWDKPATSQELFLAFGFEKYDDIDFNAEEGCTIVHDLNRPIPRELWGQYDLVFEAGTIEHIFDLRAVFENIVRLLRAGGTAFHLSPLTWVNHGFYNFSLTLFYDVYRCNGFGDTEFFVVAFPDDWERDPSIQYQKAPFTPDQIEVTPPPGTHMLICCITTKKRDLGEFRVPIQAAYDPSLKLDSRLATPSQPPSVSG